MILVDTSVWIDHLRNADPRLTRLLLNEQVLCHPFVVGELACGTMRRRVEVLSLLQHLPTAPPVDHDEVLSFVDGHRLMGAGLGWVDANILASTCLSGQQLWTKDRRLAAAAGRLGVAA